MITTAISIAGGFTSVGLLTAFLKKNKQLKQFKAAYIGLEKRIEYAKTIDEITEAYNYTYFVKAANIRIKQARRNRLPVSLMIVDIDQLEKINVHYSFATGNSALKHLYKSIYSLLKERDFAGRFGGSGIFLFLNEYTEKDMADIVEKIQKSISQNPLNINGKQITLTISISSVTMRGKQIYLTPMIAIAEDTLNIIKQRNLAYAICDHTGTIIATGKHPVNKKGF